MPRGIPNNNVQKPAETPAAAAPLILLSQDTDGTWRLRAWDVQPEVLVTALRLAIVDALALANHVAPIERSFSGHSAIVLERTATPVGMAVVSRNGAAPKRPKRLPVERHGEDVDYRELMEEV